MSRKAILALLVPTLALAGWRMQDRTARAADEAAIRATVQAYFDGMMKGDQKLLAQAFHAQAFLLGPGRDDVTRIPVETWQTSFKQPMADAAEYRNNILSIDFAGSAAVAKTELDWPRVRYVDFLSLLKVNGQWKIVNKIWHQQPSPRVVNQLAPASLPLSVADLQKYVGEYQMEHGPVVVYAEQGKLMTRLGGGEGFPMYYQGKDTFIPAIDSGIRIVFTVASGKATSFTVTQEGTSMEAKRVK
ncbi:MAG: nuclear transport factor 2 family protein [Longimicrobiales bacterium]